MNICKTLKPLKIIIVDDEPHVLEGIKSMIEWPDYDLCQPILFSDSDQAFDYMMTHDVDIVLTDVNMPGRNGLEILEDIKTNNINTEVIIISGYRDFSYVQKALEYGAVNYLTKPIFEEDLTEVLSSARANIEKKAEKELYEELYIDEGLLLYLNSNGSHDFKDVISKYDQLFMEKSYMMITLMSCDQPLDREKLIRAFLKQGLKCLEPFILNLERKIVFIVEMNQAKTYYEEYLENHFEGYYDVFLCKQSLDLIKSHYQLICKQMNMCHHYKPSKRLLEHRDMPKESKSDLYTSRFVEAISKGDDCLLEETIKEAFISFTHLDYSPSQIYQSIVDMYSQVLSSIRSHIGDVEGIEMYYDMTLKVKLISAEEILVFARKKFLKLLLLVKSAQDNQKESFKYLVEDYIHKNIHKNITLKDMAQHIHMHPTYLGQKLNKMWGESFTKHVHRLKIEKSLCIFKEGNYKFIEEVAINLGYQNYQSYLKYFKIFRQTTPKAYVKSLEKL